VASLLSSKEEPRVSRQKHKDFSQHVTREYQSIVREGFDASGRYHVRASWSCIERSSNIVSLFKELENIRINA
jgi:hypothetical protein